MKATRELAATDELDCPNISLLSLLSLLTLLSLLSLSCSDDRVVCWRGGSRSEDESREDEPPESGWARTRRAGSA